MSKLRILICGAGIAGPALAYWLLRYGFEPTLVERAPDFRASGHMIDVWGMGFEILERYGLLEAARQRGYVFDRLKFVNERGREVAALGGEVVRRALDGKFFSILRADLARVIHEALQGQAEVLYATTIGALHQHAGGIEAELSSGPRPGFDAVIGADGLHSRVRELAFGVQAGSVKPLGYVAASFLADDYPHRDEGAYVSLARPGRQISRYAMRDDRSAFLFVFTEQGAGAAHAADIAAQKSLLRRRFAADGWEVPEILDRLEAATELYFDTVSQVRLPGWTHGRVALVGDAAYCPSLLAGAGAAYAMLGAYVLAQELHRAEGSVSLAFSAYERRLRPFMQREQQRAARFASSFVPASALGIRIRDRVIRLMNVPAVGPWLVKRMFGSTDSLPLD